MSCNFDYDKLYKTNLPGIKNIVNDCDSYYEQYNVLKNNISSINDNLVSWYNTWIGTYDDSVTDTSLGVIYSSDKTIFTELQIIMTGMDNFFTSVKDYKLKNGDTLEFTYGSSSNQVRVLKNQYQIGRLNNLSIDISTDLLLDTSTDADLTTNKNLHNTRVQIGTFPPEDYTIDLHGGGSEPVAISELYNIVINGTDTLIKKNDRLIQQLTFSMNTIANIKKMLTRIV